VKCCCQDTNHQYRTNDCKAAYRQQPSELRERWFRATTRAVKTRIGSRRIANDVRLATAAPRSPWNEPFGWGCGDVYVDAEDFVVSSPFCSLAVGAPGQEPGTEGTRPEKAGADLDEESAGTAAADGYARERCYRRYCRRSGRSSLGPSRMGGASLTKFAAWKTEIRRVLLVVAVGNVSSMDWLASRSCSRLM
jgi:hypothetical protein